MTSKDNPFLAHIRGEDSKMKMMDTLKSLLNKEAEPQICGKCGQERKTLYSSKVLHYTYNGEERELSLLNAPYRRCEKCNENLESVALYAVAREILEKEIFFKLNSREQIPEELDLLKI